MKTNCYICGNQTKDFTAQDSREIRNCCKNCGVLIYIAMGELEFTINTIDDGYPAQYFAVIDSIKNKTKSKYKAECPCGINPLDCDYHK
jgi:hypothetical protein